MAWIESHQNLEEHPKILLLCQRAGWTLDEGIGKLHRLWWWVLKYAEDGDLSKYEPSQFLVRLNSKLTPEKLYETLIETNFIEKNGLIHDWLDYAGRYLHSKYHTSNPKKWNAIRKKHKVYLKSTFRRPLGPNNLPNLPNHNNNKKEPCGKPVNNPLIKKIHNNLNTKLLKSDLSKSKSGKIWGLIYRMKPESALTVLERCQPKQSFEYYFQSLWRQSQDDLKKQDTGQFGNVLKQIGAK